MSLPFFCVPSEDSSESSFLVLIPSATRVLFLKGAVKMKVVLGVAARVHGWDVTQNGEEVEVFSPKGASLASILFQGEAEEEQEENALEQAVQEMEFDFKTMKTILREWTKQDCVSAVLFSKLSPIWLPNLTSFLPGIDTSLGTNILGRDPNLISSAATLEKTLDINLLSEEVAFESGARLFQEGEQWDLALKNIDISLKKGACCMLGVGGKGVGKSTFLKYVVNNVLCKTGKPVLFVDLDPGQAEFTLPGCISATLLTEPVFGPNFCHLERDTRHTFYLGEVNMSNNKGRYLKAIELLWEKVRTDPDLQGLPIFVNSMGFTKGLGEIFIEKTIAKIKPTAVVCLRSRFHGKNYSLDFHRPDQHVCLEFGAVPESSEVRCMQATDTWGTPHPRVLRDTVVATKLGKIRNSGTANVYELPTSPSKVAFQILHGEVPVCSEDLPSWLNGGLVALCSFSDKELNSATSSSNKIVSPDAIGKCLGFGIVQCATDSNGRLILLTDLSHEEMSSVNGISIGSIRLPEAFFVTGEVYSSSPYVSERLPDNQCNPLADEWIRQSRPKNIF